MNNFLHKCLIFCFLFSQITLFAQKEIHLSLEQTLSLAASQSLEAFRCKNSYLAEYWNYQYFKSSNLPYLSLKMKPIEYFNNTTKRYDFENNLEVYKEQRIINSYANLSLNQNLPFSGGTVFLESDLSRLVNLGDSTLLAYNATIMRIGYVQPLFAFNQYKWQKKSAPLKYEIAKKVYLQKLQEIKLQALNIYFELLSAHASYQTALSNYNAAVSLYEICKKKYNILSAEYKDVLDLERNKLLAESNIIITKQKIEQLNAKLVSFLNLERGSVVITQIPGDLPEIHIDADYIIEKSNNNNSLLSENKLKILEAEKNYEKTVKENRFRTDIYAGFGLNQYADNLAGSYKSPLPQELVSIGIEIPILDWGKNKGAKQMAVSKWEEVKTETLQNKRDFEQSILLTVSEFNIQKRLSDNAFRIYDISKLNLAQTQKEYKAGNATMLELTIATENHQIYYENYINSVYLFWKKYFLIQYISLYDYINNTDITVNFDELKN